MKIGILQTGLVPEDLKEPCGEYPDMFADLLSGRGFTFEAWAVVNGQFPASPAEADGWLITGSRHGVYENHPWIAPLEQLICDIIAADKPLVGICFGHQIVAQALGGTVEKFDGGWAVGVQDYQFSGGKLTLQAWHQDQVVKRPNGAEVVASNAFCENAALLYPGKAYTVQPHPEFKDDFVEALIETRGRGVVPDALLDAAKARQGRDLNRDDLAGQFDKFFRERVPS